MASETVVVLGGGIGGVVAARRLRQRLRAEDRVVVVERDPRFRFTPSLLWVMYGTRRPEQITRDLRRLRRHGIEVIEADVEGVDAGGRIVATSTGPVPFDRLVVALGAEMDPAACPGFEDHARNIFTVDGAEAVREDLSTMGEGPVDVVVSRLPYRCPAAPWEAALLADSLLRRRGVRDRCPVRVTTPEPAPMPVAGPAMGAAVLEMLAARDIEVRTGCAIEGIGSGQLLLEGGQRIETGLVLGVPPHRPPPSLSGSGLSEGPGFLPVDPATLSTGVEGVWALGDVTALPLAGDRMLPKAGVFAEREAEVVASRVADEVRGLIPKRNFDGRGSCFVEMGDGRAGFAAGGFFGPEGPQIRLHRPGRRWHLTKVAFERWWLRRWL